MHSRLSITPVGLICAAGLAAAIAGGGVLQAADRPAPQPNPAATMPAPMPPGTTVVARVDGTELHLSDVEAAQQSLPPQVQKMPLAQIYPMLLDRLVDGMLITEAGRKDHLDQDPEVQLRLKRYEDRLIQEAYLEQGDQGRRDRGPAQGALPDLRQGEGGARRGARPAHPGQDRGRGEFDHRRARQGRRFRRARQEAFDRPGASSGGDLGYFGHDDMVKEFADAAFALPPGQYTKTPVKTEFGWHVIKVEDHRVSTPPSFDEAREEVSQLVAHDVVDAKLKELRASAKVETYGLDGKPLPSSAK